LRRRARALVALPNPSSTAAIAGRRSAGPDVSLIACGLAQATGMHQYHRGAITDEEYEADKTHVTNIGA
jgi:hypothetical protein